MNIVKELHEIAKRNYKNQLDEVEMHLDSVKENLINEDKEDNRMIKFFGTNNVVVEQQKRKRDVVRLSNDECVTLDDIKKICLKYKLRFLNSSYYKKQIPLNVLHDLKSFQKSENITDFVLSNNLMVIAPQNHFSLGKKPAKDPILLYKHDEEYRIISKWGNDFNFTRVINGFISCHWPLIFLAIFLSVTAYLGIYKDGMFFLLLLALFPICAFMVQSDSFETQHEKWDIPYK